MAFISRIFTLLVPALYLLDQTTSLKLGAFNLKVFGKSKASKPDVLQTLTKIISRYDIILLMEIRDTTSEAIRTLKSSLNKEKDVFEFVVSDRLGRSKSKEQYIFVYRKDRSISVVDSYHYDDGDEETQSDTFEREPFIVRFRSEKTVVPTFSLVGIHTKPEKAVSEIQSLRDVFEDVKSRWGGDNIIVLGDLNADCNYVRKSHWSKIDLRTDPEFYWPIGDDVDTTMTDTDCAYDRFVISGKKLQDSVIDNSAGIFDFQKAFKMTVKDALAVSDHFPIELDLREGSGVTNGSHIVSLAAVVLSSVFVARLVLC